MSYQTSIHFDPTALLIIKNEIDNSIKLVETAVNTLAEEQALPFGIDDALNQFEQCTQVLALIDMPHLSQITQYSSELMRKIMAQPQQIKTSDVVALSEGTTMLKRYIEFICLREVKVPQFLLDTLNRLELALGKPLTKEGQTIQPLLSLISPRFNLPLAPTLEKSQYIHQLYKLCLHKLIKQTETPLDLQGIKLVGVYLAGLSTELPSQQYWQLVNVALGLIDELSITEARLRTLIQIETNIAKFLNQPSTYAAELSDLADVLSICISQENNISHHIRDQLNIGDELLSDTQLQVLSRHLYGPDYETIHTVSRLMTDEMAQIRNEIEYNYQNMSTEKTQEIQQKLNQLANVFKVLNLNEAAKEITQQAEKLSHSDFLTDANSVQQLMNGILASMNSIGILERNYTSSRLQLRVNNLQISLDRLDEAHKALLTETKTLIETLTQTLSLYAQDPTSHSIEALPDYLKELSGAAQFLGSTAQQTALLGAADFAQHRLAQNQALDAEQINCLLNVVAGLDLLVDNLRNKQPVLQSMFDVALSNSQQLQTIAA
ncbi:chemotaxis protein [Acinetobacter haemolyticus]|uniref:Chemotaxis protein n=1 Tax=Acinetobacter haemolyticus TaxID=29430 RepID=A0A1L6KP01_ACIHA|nr:chemotaxis protein [Acinetobacter haemolyticus]APR70795.1 chemotaxis protein [Acinetobacter haemolyticus]MBO3658154.1 chemotaxis protein [Acinetobacter haemolyticus]MCU4388595.1 chemotaxis protein [Acinetobacter haemolyticus]NAR17949.1 chemotaxis protein [Acinetobacter haemolyticus]NAR30555.1 chemotaxis protein [Acinetobacter haemolyticus]